MAVDDLRTGTWVTYIGGRASGKRVRRCRLEVIAGPDKGLVRDIEDSVIRIGARRGNDLQLSDSKVSGLHVEIQLDDRGYRLFDLDSTNGTYVSGLRVNDVYISPGTPITLGGSKVRFDPQGQSVEVELSNEHQFGGMIGSSVKMRELFARLEKLAPSDATVLIDGDTGTGKELVAEALHEYSTRKNGPFVVLDCGSIPQNLIESELFGHEKGSFTGATSAYAGAFERAHGGTVFLDEIGELPLEMQPKLLRVLERHEVRRIGGSRINSVDIRVVAASNRDLGVEVNRGRFREDLYYRLAVARIHVPALRERLEDIPLLIEHFLSITPGGDASELEADTVELMMKHDWPGNVRELRNVIERAVLLAEAPATEAQFRRSYAPHKSQPKVSDGRGDGSVDASGKLGAGPKTDPDLGASSSRLSGSSDGSDDAAASNSASSAGSSVDVDDAMMYMRIDTGTPFKVAKRDLVAEFERRYITTLLEEHGGNISAAARAAGIDRMSIHKMLNRLGLNPRAS